MRIDTPLEFYIVDQDEYVAGDYNQTRWKKVAEDNGATTYYASWSGTYGAVQAAAMTAGITESVNVRMPFAPNLYEALAHRRVIVAKNGADILKEGQPDRLNPNCYELYSGVNEKQNRMMNFMLKRYEGK
nr:MAG TPA: hypothetical protein [Caudoviricetes sp.]